MGIASMIYKKTFIRRYDDDHIIHYFSYRDFPGLQAEPLEFRTKQGNLIKGNIYSYPNPTKANLVIFCHGLGGGHRSYMREIERLCREGYEVLSYDNTGCFDSEGADIRGLTESLNVLVSCMDYIASDESLRGRKLDMIGHSWGGYAVGNILAFRPANICSITVISSFLSLSVYLDKGFGGKTRLIKNSVMKFERRANPDYADCNGTDVLKTTNVPVFFIQSKDDCMIDIKAGLEYVKANVSNPKVFFLSVDGKGHNPNYTKDAAEYMRNTFSEYHTLIKKKKLKTFEEKQAYMDSRDFYRMTCQDEEIWSKIFNFMASSRTDC